MGWGGGCGGYWYKTSLEYLIPPPQGMVILDTKISSTPPLQSICPSIHELFLRTLLVGSYAICTFLMYRGLKRPKEKLDTNVWKTKKNSQVSLKTRKYDTKFTCLVGDLLFSCVITCHGPIV